MILTVEIEPTQPAGGPPSGSVTAASGETARFSGWTGLLSALVELGQSVPYEDAPPATDG